MAQAFGEVGYPLSSRNHKLILGIHGDSYIGEWKQSKAEGYGVHTWKNGI